MPAPMSPTVTFGSKRNHTRFCELCRVVKEVGDHLAYALPVGVDVFVFAKIQHETDIAVLALALRVLDAAGKRSFSAN